MQYPPPDAKSFAEKYIAGYYTYAPKSKPRKPPSSALDAAAAAAAAPKAQDNANPMLAGLEQLYTSHSGDLTAIFAALGEDPTKALKVRPRPRRGPRPYFNGRTAPRCCHMRIDRALL
jgi:hypothetical protein